MRERVGITCQTCERLKYVLHVIRTRCDSFFHRSVQNQCLSGDFARSSDGTNDVVTMDEQERT